MRHRPGCQRGGIGVSWAIDLLRRHQTSLQSIRCSSGASKPDHRSGGKTKLILRIAEKMGLKVITLHAPGNRFSEAKIHPAAQRRGNGGIRIGKARATGVRVGASKKRLRERRHFPERHRRSRAGQKRVDVCVGRRRALADDNHLAKRGHPFGSVVAAKIENSSEPRDRLVLRGGEPAVQVGTANGRGQRPVG